MSFKIGDHVEWDTFTHGVTVKRTGIISYIMKPFTSLFEEIDNGEMQKVFSNNFQIIYNKMGDFRPEESYLVNVCERDGQIPNLHWPRVESLSKIKAININPKKKKMRKWLK